MPERLPLFDALKGFAILMVVYTHVLQFAGIGYYLDNPVFEFTYAFHMPLFIIKYKLNNQYRFNANSIRQQ